MNEKYNWKRNMLTIKKMRTWETTCYLRNCNHQNHHCTIISTAQKFILLQIRTIWCFVQTDMKEWCDHQSYTESHCTTILVLTFGNVLLLCCKEEERVAKLNGVWRLKGTDSLYFLCRTYIKIIARRIFPTSKSL